MYVRYDVLIRRLGLDELIDDDVYLLYFPGQRAAGGEGEREGPGGRDPEQREQCRAAIRDTVGGAGGTTLRGSG